MINGITASSGIAIAKAYKLEVNVFKIEKLQIDDINQEINRLNKAIEISKNEITKIREQTEKKLGIDKAKIFEAHLLVVEDPELIGKVKEKINIEKVNAEYALKEVRDMFIQIFEAMDNEYMKERASDVKDVTNRIFSKLLNTTENNPSLINEEVIIIANDLTPSDTAQLDKAFVKGFATNIGGRTSHSAIMARSLEIPAVVGTKNITELVNNGDLLIIDGIEGKILINPDEKTINDYKEKQHNYEQEKIELAKLKDKPTVTLDNKQVELAANIGSVQDLKGVLNNGAEAIGLFRTEFLYMGRDNFPTEEEQYESYKTVLEKMNNKTVVIRTLDIGGDKELSYLKMPKEMNPFLGYRAIRLCLDRKDIFRTQLRALLRASIYGNLKIMFPMIATINEFTEAKEFLLSVKDELIKEGISVSEQIEIGIMVEIPAVALLADQFAKVVDFFSIGTNDLIQYTFAADRMNEHVSYLYQPYNPSLLRMIKMVIDAGHKENKWVGMCGEMAGDRLAIPLLLGLGLDEFSMSASSVLPSRLQISKLNVSKMQKLANEALEMSTVLEVEELIKRKLNY